MNNQAPKRKYYDPMDDILDRPISYNPAFKRITKSTVAGIFLSQCWYWSKRNLDREGWFYKCGREWEEETGLTRSEQETARKYCLQAGVIEEDLRSVPATMHYRVIKSRIYELLGIQFAGIPQTEIEQTPQTEIEEIPQTSLTEIPQFADKQQSDIPANINKESEITTIIPSENTSLGDVDLRKLFLKAAPLVLPGVREIFDLRTVTAELEGARFSMEQGTYIVSGLPGDRPGFYEDRYRKSFENVFIGLLGEEVSIRFTGSGDVSEN